MNIGFIGTGKITTSVIQGLFRSNIKLKQILISERNKKNSLALSKKFKKVKVVKDNQEIIQRSSWVFIAVVPTVAKKILKELTFKKNQTVVSFVSTLNMTYLKKHFDLQQVLSKQLLCPQLQASSGQSYCSLRIKSN